MRIKRHIIKFLIVFVFLIRAFFGFSQPCYNAPYGLYPTTTFTTTCNGTYQTITTCGYLGEYSQVNVVAGTTYSFQSSIGTDVITIDNNGAAPALAVGTGTVTWTSTITGVIRFYTHGAGCTTSAACRTRRVMCGTALPPPANNLVCSATTISCNQTIAGTTVNATNSGTGENLTCGTIQTTAGVWYVVAGTGGVMTASLCGTAWDSKISVFSGTNCNTLTCVGGNDDNGPACAGTSASYSWTSVVGVNYYILVHGYSTTSAFNINLTCITPPPPCTSNTVVLNLLDSFGDGWNGATYTLTSSTGTVVSTGTLSAGSAGTVSLCLPNGCYTMSVTAGTWPGEVSWNYSFNGATVASGGAPATNIQVPINIVCPPPPPSPQDCSGSQLVCADQAVNGVSTGFGNTQDLNATNQGCLTTEHQSTWLNATVATAGTFSFNIVPSVASDYDFAVWTFPAGTTLPCPPNIAPVRCSFAAGSVNTGIGNGATDVSEGATGDSWVSVLNVNPGDKILILIDNFSASTNPFTMDFTGSASLASGGVITGNTTLCVNATSQLSSTGSPSLSTPWASSNPAVATVSNTGLVTAVSAGTTTITYTNNAGCQTTTTLTVNANPNASISGVLAICGTQSTTLTANGGGTYSWSNSLGTNAAVTINSAGTYTVTVTAPNGCSANASATVVGNVNPTITGSTTVCINSTSQLTGSGTAATTNPWLSSNSAVATVSSTGLVTGISSGTITITYTNSNGCSITTTVTVNDIIDWANLQFPGSGSICQGGSYTIYGQFYNTGVINTPDPGQAAGVIVQYGYSSTNSNPSTWTNWSNATFNTQVGNNDEYMATITGLTAGTYYYAFRYQINNCGWQYGGFSSTGGGIWDGTTNVNGSLIVNPSTTPTFSSVGPYCWGATIPALPTNSTNGITGSWSPSINNSATTTYTFTPASNSAPVCATTTQLTIVITPQPNQPTIACYETATWNPTTCIWDITGTQPAAPTGLACYQISTWNPTTCVWDITGTQPAAPTGLACYQTSTWNPITCIWDITGTQPAAPTGLACYQISNWNPTTCIWDITGTQPAAPTGLACYQTSTWNPTTCVWDITGTQPAAPTGLACYQTSTWNPTTCVWDITGTQPAAPTGLACYQTATWNATTCQWDVTGSQPNQPTIACYETATWNATTCQWDVTGSQPNQPTIACYETATWNATTCQWDVTGSQPNQPTIACYETATWNATTCQWDVTGSQPNQPTIACYETATWNATTCQWDVTGSQPNQPTIACYETATWNPTTCVWDITGTQPAAPTGLACYQTSTWNPTTCVWDITGTQPAAPTGLACYQTATWNPTTCVWDITGTQPAAPTGLACYQTATWNPITCQWDVTGSQPNQPTIACYETATWNAITCQWDVTGSQPNQPTIACYETATWNATTCQWDVTGSQPNQPTIACYETATWNATTCQWDVTGSQPNQPAIACYETATWNATTCQWDVTGSQPNQPTIACYETATWNATTCQWDVTGSQPNQPAIACYETATWNATTCQWDVTGSQPNQPAIACYETATWNATTCQWDVTGSQPNQPAIACYETATWNATTCQWDVTGSQPNQPAIACYETATWNATTCQWDVTGSQPNQPAIACYETATWNATTCQWDVTGSQPNQPTIACYETATWNAITCQWDVTGSQPNQPAIACYETATWNATTCQWDVTGSQPNQPAIACYETATWNATTCQWDVTGSQPNQPTIACYETATWNATTCQWDVTGSQPNQPTIACYETATWNAITCQWDVTGSQPNQPTIACYETATWNATTCQWDVTGSQPNQPTIACYETATWNATTCQWDVTGSQPNQPTIACYETATWNAITCQWDVTGSQPNQPTIACYETATWNAITCQWDVTGSQPNQPTIACYETATWNATTCQWDVTGSQPNQPTIACYETATWNATTCQWDVTGSQPNQPTIACYETATWNATTCQWDVTGSQPNQPTIACYETATWNATTCQWDVTGSQPNQPTIACYETATWNATTCQWDVTGSQPNQPTIACYETATWNAITCQWDVTGSQPNQPTIACYETATWNAITCQWDVTGSQPNQPTIACYETATWNATTCQWDVTGSQPNQPTIACYETATWNATTCQWDVTGSQPNQPTIACYETATWNATTCQWDVTGSQPNQPTIACYETATWNATTCQWDVTGSQPNQPTIACYETATWNATTCQWDVTGSQPNQPTIACYETATWNATTCQWDVTGSQPNQPTIACYETATWNAITCQWDVTGSQPNQPTIACYETATWNATTCQWDVTGSQPNQPAIACYETATWNATTCQWDVTGSQPNQPTIACYETAIWNATTCQWDVTGSQPNQPSIACYETATWNATTCQWDVTGSQPNQPTIACYETATWNATTCQWDVTGSQPNQPAIACYETATWNATTCQWDVTGSQPNQPTIACYETATWNATTCQWDVTGSQPNQPAIACYETATWNATTCQWDVTGSQPNQPTIACYETATWNATTCQWDVTGSQPNQPTIACYETATWNATTCQWDVTGSQPNQPTIACYETATWNATTCQWDVTGSQPNQPTIACYETATWNATTCQWDVTGSQPNQPTIACYETATWNATTCQWDVTGSQPNQPAIACYETATWNATTCQWDVTGSQPNQPTIACYETAIWNATTCQWDVTGSQPNQPSIACYETATWNATTCQWDVTGSQPNQPTIACYETAIWNATTCQWDVTGSQPNQPTIACYETATWNATTCQWDVTGSQPNQPTIACYETATWDATTCQWDVTGSQPNQPAIACYETATWNATTCQWDVTGSQPNQPTIACYETATWNATTCQWDVTGSQPNQPAIACYETAIWNATTCQWDVTGSQPNQPTIACYETATWNATTCQWDVTGSQPNQPTIACYETATWNATTCQWDVTGSQPNQPTIACYETATWNAITCQWDVTGSQPNQPTIACYETATWNATTCQWDVTGSQPNQPTIACYETATWDATTCQWDVTGSQPNQPTIACYETATWNATTCQWDVTGSQPNQPTIACYETATWNATTCQWDVTAIPAPTISVNNDTICIGSSAVLSATPSVMGGSYTWSTNSTTQSITVNPTVTTTYTVTYDLNNCFQVSAQGIVTVNQLATSSFYQVGEICSGGSFSLPVISNEGFTGTWSPSINNSATTTYQFTPTNGQCAANATMTVQVSPSITPAFNQVPPICSGTVLNSLPTTSTNGISGTWSPVINNLQTTNYTFTPDISPGPDCDQAANLCSSSTIYSVNNLNGGGNNDDEPESNTCMDVVGPDEQNSAWFIWTAANAGNLTFDIIPTLQSDDIDFILYEITGDNPCGDRTVIRCNSASCLNTQGSTGLSMSDTDVSEDPNCDPGENGYCQFITTIPGRTYALLVNNCNTNQGFSLQFNNGVSNPAQFALPNSSSTFYNSTTCNGQCASSASMTIVVNQPSNIVIDSTICSNVLPITWNGISVNSAGSYTANLISAAGCDSVVTLNLSIITVNATTTQTNVLCFGNTTGSIDLTVSGGTSPYTYSWDNGLVSEDLTGIGAGTYVISITDANGCTTSSSATITQPASGITLTESHVNVLCQGNATGSIDLTVTGGSGTYIYSWDNGQNTEDLLNLSAGTYTVTVTDNSNCTASLSVTITEPISALSTSTSVMNVLCNGNSTGAIDLTVSGGTSPYSFNWSNGLLSEDLSNLTAGTYTVVITDNNGCTVSTNATVTEPVLPLTSSTTQTNVLCFGNTTGSIDLTVSGGTSPYTYSWDNGLVSEDLIGIGAGTYVVSITDANGCTTSSSATITQPASGITLTESHVNVLCQGNATGSIDLTVTGGSGTYIYSWDNGQNTEDLLNLSAGTYTVTVTDNSNCTASLSVTITEPISALSTSTSVMNVLCNGNSTGAIDLTVSGGTSPYSFNWSNGLLSEDLSNLTAGTYTVVITDNNGCTVSTNATVTEPVLPLTSTTTQTNVLCFGNTTGYIDLTVSGGTSPYTYSWDNGIVSDDLTGIGAGTYVVSITDANGCTTSSSATITQPASGISASISNQVNVSCNGLSDGSLVINVTGGSGNYLISPSQNNLAAGNYNFTISDLNGCSILLNAVISEPTPLAAQLTNTIITYSGGTSTITVSASGGTAPYTGVGTYSVTAGTYNYTVVDANGCSDIVSVTITEPLPLSVTSTAGLIQCNGGSTSVTVSATGGTAPYSGVGVFSETVGSYVYTITDFYGNTASTSITLTEPSPLLTSSSATSILCNGNQSTVTVVASGGVSPYIGTGIFSENAGTYNYTVTDANGCTSTTSVIITQPSALVVTDLIQNVMCQGGSGSVNITISGGVGPYNVVWNGSVNTEDLLSVAAGTYNGLITDANGCQVSIQSIVQNDFAIQPTLSNVTGTYQLTCAVTSINLQVNNAISYTWSGGLSAGTISNSFNSPDTYFVDVLDANNCPSQLSATITQNINPPTPGINNISNNLILTCTNPSINVQATGGVSYQWSNGLSNTASQSLTQPGTYTVTVIGSNACTATSSLTITSNQTAPTAVITNNTGSTVLHCNQSQINVTASGGVSYSWSNGLGTNPTVNLTTGGTYTVTVTAANGCTDTETITINQLQNPTVTVSPITMCAGATGTLTAVPSTPGGTFVWTQFPSNVQLPGNSASVSISPTTNSLYNVQYFDIYNCPSNISMANVTVNQTPVANISGSSSICSGNTAILTANSSLTGANGFYTWSPITSSLQTVSVTPLTSTNYSVIYTLNGCPSAAANHLVTVYQTPVVTVNNVGICTGGQATLTANPDIAGGTYSWNTFPTPATTQSITVQPSSTSTFTVVYTSPNNCPSQSATATVTVTDVPTVVVNDINVCEGQSGNLMATPSVVGGVYNWNPGGMGSATLTVTPDSSMNVSVVYILNGCPSIADTAFVTVINTPSVSVSDVAICANQTATLTAIPSTQGGTFLWSTTETTPVINVAPNSTSLYSVTYFDNGCASPTAFATVTVDPIPVVTFDVDITEGCLPLTVNLTNTTLNTTNCTWNIENNGVLNECGELSYTFQSAGCYDISLTTDSPNGCTNTLMLSDLICAYDSPNADFSLSATELNVSDPIVTINNNSTGAVDYIWNYGDNTSDTSIFNPEPHLFEGYLDSMYIISLVAISENGCVDSMNQIITFNDDVTIYAPNSFTPDEDGLNEIWLPVISSGINPNSYQLRIFNRWGQEFFATNNILQGWDGTYLGDKVQDGTYSFQLVYSKSGQTKKNVIVGHINLIR